MKKLLTFCFVAALIMVLFSADRAEADDFNPPVWRGDPLTVEAEWDFWGPVTTGISPDGIYNTVGGSGGETLSTYWTHIDGTGPWVADPDGSGPKGAGWAFSGFVIHLANWIDIEPYKDIRLQLTGYMSNGGEVTFFADPQPDITSSSPPLDAWMMTDSGSSYDDAQDITRAWYDFRLWPNPDKEDIWFNVVPAGVIIDQVYVDTISTPEPTTIVLLGLGGLLLRRRKSQA